MTGPADPLPKTWGWSTRVYCNEQLQVERIIVKAGGYSSIHLHAHKVNQFLVSTGTMNVMLFDEQLRSCQSQLLQPGEYYVVPTGVRHQFHALTACEGYEFYWPSDLVQLDPNDIVRFSSNGVADKLPQPDAMQLGQYVYCCICNQQHALQEMQAVCLENAMRHVCRDCMGSTNVAAPNAVSDHIPTEEH